MNDNPIPLRNINGTPLTAEQRKYLEGFFVGLAAQGVQFGNVEPAPAPEKKVSLEDLIFEERVKRELHPLDAYEQIVEKRRRQQGAR